MNLAIVFKGFVLTVYLFFMPVYPIIGLVGAFIILDTIMGVTASYVKKEPILSRKLMRLAVKLGSYTAITILIYGLDILILSDTFGLDSTTFLPTKIVAGTLCFIESFSIDEKIRKMNNDKGVKYYWTLLVQMIKGAKKDINEMNEK